MRQLPLPGLALSESVFIADQGKVARMDPVDQIRRLIDEGTPDVLSKISEVLGCDGGMKLPDADLCAVEFAVSALRAIAERKRMVGDVIEPVNDIRVASRLAREALRRFEGVADNLTA